MRVVSLMIKPASSKCNLKCRYCFYADVASKRMVQDFGIMPFDVADKLIERIFEEYAEDDVINIAFQGGEPTVAGLEYFTYFVNKVNELKERQQINYSLQTNATLIEEDWLPLLKNNDFLVGVSLDGYKYNHDVVRIDKNEWGTYDKVMEKIKMLEEAGIQYNILTVLTSSLSKDPVKLFNFYKENKFNYIQLVPCLPPLDKSVSDYSLKPEEFYEFYKVFFDKLWEEYKRGNRISETLFDNVLEIFSGYPPIQCGYNGRCSKQYVVESNGDVYPCDFYVLDKYKMGNVKNDNFKVFIGSAIAERFILEKRNMSSLCNECKYLRICNGQCKRMNVCYFNDNYCGYKLLLEYIEKKIKE